MYHHLLHLIGLKLPVQLLWRLLQLNTTLRQTFSTTFWYQRGSIEFPSLPPIIGCTAAQYFINHSRSGYGDLYVNNHRVKEVQRAKQLFVINRKVAVWTQDGRFYHLDLFNGTAHLVSSQGTSQVTTIIHFDNKLLLRYGFDWRLIEYANNATYFYEFKWPHPATIKSIHYLKQSIGETVIYLSETGELFCYFHPSISQQELFPSPLYQPLYEQIPIGRKVIRVIAQREKQLTMELIDGTIKQWSIVAVPIVNKIYSLMMANYDQPENIERKRKWNKDGRLIIDSYEDGDNHYIIV